MKNTPARQSGNVRVFTLLVTESRIAELRQLFNAMSGVRYQLLPDPPKTTPPEQEGKKRLKVTVPVEACFLIERICASELASTQHRNHETRVS